MANKKYYTLEEMMQTLDPESRTQVERRVQRTLRRMRLKELRQARKLSQAALAKKLKVEQPAVAKLEKRADMYVSTLRHYLHAVGAELQIVAKYPNGSIEIANFRDM